MRRSLAPGHMRLYECVFLLDDLSEDLMTDDTELLSDILMNAFAFPSPIDQPTRRERSTLQRSLTLAV